MSDTQIRKGRGCFFYGCLVSGVLFIVCALGLYFGAQYVINRMVESYTVATPTPVPQVQATPEEVKAVQDRFRNFAEALRAGSAVEPLVLSERDLNLLINNARDLAQFTNHIHVAIEGRKLKGTMSLPLDSFGLRRLRGRYFNGVAELKASLSNGVLMVTLDALEVNGKPLPEQVMNGFRGQNLAKDVYRDEKSLQVLRRIETIEVDDGRILVKPYPVGQQPPAGQQP